MADETRVTSSPLVVLFADIAGSTALYDTLGDAVAREVTSECINVLAEVTARFDGRLVKTIGDEVMCAFQSPAPAIMAGTDMQVAVRTAGEEGRFKTGALRIRCGLHFGFGLEEETEVRGEAAIVAAELAKYAKADQTVTSGETVKAAPVELRAGTRFLEHINVEGRTDPVEVYELIWEVSGLTQVADVASITTRVTHSQLHLSFGGQDFLVDESNPSLSFGRVDGNDVVVPTDLTSRQHAEIEYRRGRFRITDNSSNGTTVVQDNGTSTTLRRDGHILNDSGQICLGGTPENNPTGVVR